MTPLSIVLIFINYLLLSSINEGDARKVTGAEALRYFRDILIISGGVGSDDASYTVEAFVPATGQHCKLPNIPAKPNSWELGPRFGHSMEGLKICSGGPQTESRANCISLIKGTWKLANILGENRVYHSSWASPSGRRLLGSFFSRDTTEILREDGSGTSDSGFGLRYRSS